MRTPRPRTGASRAAPIATDAGSVRLPSISDVAGLAGVSTGTVSNVLNRPQVVAAPTRARVEAAIAALGFVRNESARHLGSGRSRAIGLVVLDLANPFFTDIAHGAQHVARQRGAVLLIADSQEDADIERSNVQLFAEQRVQGLLIAPSGSDRAMTVELTRAGMPVVILDQAAKTSQHCSVTVDDRHGGRLAADHLLSLGHRRLVFLGGPPRLPQVVDRRTGAQQAIRAVEGARMTTIRTRGLNVAEGRSAAAKLSALPEQLRPTAVFAANDLLALGLLQGLMGAGARIPQDMAVIGYDDIDFAAAAAVPLSSIRQPREELGRRATEVLFQEIALFADGRPHAHQQLAFQPSLVVRRSTGGAADSATGCS